MQITSIGDARYFVTFIDDYSRKVWMYIFKSKRKILQRFKKFKSLVEIQSKHKIKVLQSNNRYEYICKELHYIIKKHGIEKQTSIPYTPQ